MWSGWSTGESQRGSGRNGTAGESGCRWDRSVLRYRLEGARGVTRGEGLIVGPADWLSYEGRKPVLRERISASRNIGVDYCRISTSIITAGGTPGERGV